LYLLLSTLPFLLSPLFSLQHDAQLDYYGKRLATCSSDRSIRIFDVHASHAPTVASQIRGHEGPVWQVGWAHPKFGSVLASCSYDGRACVWKEQAANNWIKIYEYSRPDSSINAIQWAPHSFGLVLAVGAADGTVSVLSRKQDNTWDVANFRAHNGGVNSVSWGPDGQSTGTPPRPVGDRKLPGGGGWPDGPAGR
jgi:protein transport protein SEC13